MIWCDRYMFVCNYSDHYHECRQENQYNRGRSVHLILHPIYKQLEASRAYLGLYEHHCYMKKKKPQQKLTESSLSHYQTRNPRND